MDRQEIIKALTEKGAPFSEDMTDVQLEVLHAEYVGPIVEPETTEEPVEEKKEKKGLFGLGKKKEEVDVPQDTTSEPDVPKKEDSDTEEPTEPEAEAVKGDLMVKTNIKHDGVFYLAGEIFDPKDATEEQIKALIESGALEMKEG